MSEHKWKIGDWAEFDGQRCIVVDVDEKSELLAVSGRAGNAWPAIGSLRFPAHQHPRLKPLPDCTGWDWQPPKPEPKYRPFANAEEFKPHRGRWIYFCDQISNQLLIYSFTDGGIWHADKFTLWQEMFAQCKFDDDGSPFGVRVDEEQSK